MNEPDNTLKKIYLTKDDLISHSRWKDMYEIVNLVIVSLGKKLDEEKAHESHRLLGALFLPKMTASEKMRCLKRNSIFRWKVIGRRC